MRSVAQRAFLAARAEMAEMYHKGYSAHDIMDGTHKVLTKYGIPYKGHELRSRICVAVWNLAPRPGVPRIRDMLANRSEFQMWDEHDDTPCLPDPWWEAR